MWIWLLALTPSYAGSVRATLELTPEGPELVSAVYLDEEVHSTPGELEIVSASGEVVQTAALPPLATHRSVVHPEGGGDAGHIPLSHVRVSVPWPVEAEALRLGEVSITPQPAGTFKSTLTPEAVLYSGTSESRLDLVFFAEGYQADEEADFASDVTRVVSHMMTVEPYGSYAPLFNIWRVFTPSDDSGVTNATGSEILQTAFDCAYDCLGIERLICCDENQVTLTVDASAPFADGVMLLANSDTYGGSGGAVYSTSFTGDGIDSLQVALHELGHTLIGLWDEYDYGISWDAETAFDHAPNCSSTAEDVCWPEWHGTDNIGAFRACSYSNAYRPTNNSCMMRSLQDQYCPVCRERIIETIYDNLGATRVTNASPAVGSSVVVGKNESATLQVEALEPLHGLTWEWTYNGALLSTERHTYEIAGCSNIDGEVQLTLRDDTEWVRRDEGNLSETVVWNVQTEKCGAFCSAAGNRAPWGGLLLALPWLFRRRRANA